MSGIWQVQSKIGRNARWANERGVFANRCAAIKDAKALLGGYIGKAEFRVRVIDTMSPDYPPDVAFFQIKRDEE